MTRRSIVLALPLLPIVAIATLATACAATRPQSSPPPPTRPAGPRVEAGDLVAAPCGLPSSMVFFAPDSSDLDLPGAALVDAIAACLTSGPLQGRAVVLVASSDATGAGWFDSLLADSRANTVANRLMHAGVDPVRMARVALGALGPSTDPLVQAIDRRVEIRTAR